MQAHEAKSSYQVGLGGRAWLRVIGYTILWGVIPGLMATLMLGADAISWINGPFRYDPSTYSFVEQTIPLEVQHTLGFVVAALVPALGIGCAIACLRLRAPRQVTIDLDAWGVTERVGDEVRTAIAWAGAKVRALELRVFSRGSRVGTYHLLSIGDARGHAICVHDGLRGDTWTRRRPTTTSRTFGLAALGAKPNVEELQLDRRDARRGLSALATFCDLGIAACLAGFVIAMNDWDVGSMGIALLAAASHAGVRTLRPLLELTRLLGEHLAMRAAVPIRLTGPAGDGRAQFLGAGTQGVVDLSEAVHPDARLAERTTDAFAILDAAGGASAYRGSGMRATAIETARDRAERRRLVIACILELVLRGLQILAFVVLAIVVVNRWQEH